MDNKRIVKMLFKLHMDDLKDADMLCDYASQIANMGDASTAAVIYSRAKIRLQQMADCEKTIENIMQRIKEDAVAAGETYHDDGIYSDMYKEYVTEWSNKIRMKLENA